MEQSPFWEANRSSATQETDRVLCNPKAHCRTDKRPLQPKDQSESDSDVSVSQHGYVFTVRSC